MFLGPQGMTSQQYAGGIAVMENCIINHGAISPRWPFAEGVLDSSMDDPTWANPGWLHEIYSATAKNPTILHISRDGKGQIAGDATRTYAGAVTQSQWAQLAGFGVVTLYPQTPEVYNISAGTWAAASYSGDTPTVAFGIAYQFKGRIYYAEGDGKSTKFYYTAVNAVNGALTDFDLDEFGAGPIINIKALTRDGGSGPDDYIAFFCANNLVFVYQGADPGDSNDWSLVGKFFIPSGIARLGDDNCAEKRFEEVAGDIIIVNGNGLVSLRESMTAETPTPPSWALPINETLRAWMNIKPRTSVKHDFSFVKVVEPAGLTFVHCAPNFSATEDEDQGALYVYDSQNKSWYRWGVYKGSPTRYGDQRDVFPAYDSDVVANGDADRRHYDFVPVDITKTGFVSMIARDADTSQESYNGATINALRGLNDFGGTAHPNYDIEGSVLWSIQPLDRSTCFHEARIDAKVTSGTVNSLSLHIGTNGGALQQQLSFTSSGWENEFHTISAQGNTVQVRLDFSFTPDTSVTDTRDIVSVISGFQIFGVELIEKQGGEL